MGLGKKLGQCNLANNQILQTAITPVTVNGFNDKNIPTLQNVVQPMTQQETVTVRQVADDAKKDYINKEQNRSGLIKPQVPMGSQYPNAEVSHLVVEKMWRIVCVNELHAFYTQDQLQNYVNKACLHDYRILMKHWNLPTIDMAVDLAVLGLYDIVIFADDSGSMDTFEKKEGMTRFDILKEVLKTIGFWSSLLDPDGVVVRFFNSTVEGNGISTLQDIQNLFSNVHPSGSTPMGNQMYNKIINKIIAPSMTQNDLLRPVLIITITDGVPDNNQAVIDTIKQATIMSRNSRYGNKAIAFSFAQIGSDVGATEYLNQLDAHPEIGKNIDCTSEFSIEAKQCGQGFSEAVWVVKLMIGAVDPDYDTSDEIQNGIPLGYQQQGGVYQQQSAYQPQLGYPQKNNLVAV